MRGKRGGRREEEEEEMEKRGRQTREPENCYL